MNVDKMSLQEIFEHVGVRLLFQNQVSVVHILANRFDERSSVDRCSYRGPNGTKCGIGHLIDDADYRYSLEGGSVFREDVLSALGFSIKEYDDASVIEASTKGQLLLDLQRLHDVATVAEWPMHLWKIAGDYGLEFSHALEAAIRTRDFGRLGYSTRHVYEGRLPRMYIYGRLVEVDATCEPGDPSVGIPGGYYEVHSVWDVETGIEWDDEQFERFITSHEALAVNDELSRMASAGEWVWMKGGEDVW
jgi:hypothetical protein